MLETPCRKLRLASCIKLRVGDFASLRVQPQWGFFTARRAFLRGVKRESFKFLLSSFVPYKNGET